MKNFLLFSLLFFTSTAFFLDAKITIKTSGGEVTQYTGLDELALGLSQTIKDYIEAASEDEVIIPLLNISKETFEKVLECLKIYFQGSQYKASFEEEIYRVLKLLNGAERIEFQNAASYLGVPNFLEICPLTIITADESKYEFWREEKSPLMYCGIIKELVQQYEDRATERDAAIPLPLVKAEEFDNLLPHLQVLSTGKSGKEQIFNDLQKLGREKLFRFLEIVSYLDVPDLLIIGCKAWSENYELDNFQEGNASFIYPDIIDELRKLREKSIRDFFLERYLEKASLQKVQSKDCTIEKKDFFNVVDFAKDSKHIAYATTLNDLTGVLYNRYAVTIRSIDKHQRSYVGLLENKPLNIKFGGSDDRYLIMSLRNVTLELHDLQTKDPRVSFEVRALNDAFDNQFSLSKDRKKMAYKQDNDKIFSIKVIDLDTSEELTCRFSEEIDEVEKNRNFGVTTLAFHFSNDFLAYSSCKKMHVWDISSGKADEDICEFNEYPVLDFGSFSEDGVLFASYSRPVDDNKIIIYEIISGKEVCSIWADKHPKSLKFSPNNEYLLVRESTKNISIWNVKSGTRITTLSHEEPIKSYLCCNDNLLISNLQDNHAKFWNIASGECLHTMKKVQNLYVSPNKSKIVFGFCDSSVKKLALNCPITNLLSLQNDDINLLLALYKHKIENSENIKDMLKKDHLLEIFNSLPDDASKFLKGINVQSTGLKKLKSFMSSTKYKKKFKKTKK